MMRAVEATQPLREHAAGAVLFTQSEAPKGVCALRRGRMKLSVSARDGRTLILRMVEAGELLGVASVISGHEYEATGEAQEPCEISFIRRTDLLRLMHLHGELAVWVTQRLSHDYTSTCQEIRNLMLSDSASEKLARLLVGWLDDNANSKRPDHLKLAMTHEEIGQMIGTSRETVTRLFAGFKKQRFIEQNGSTLVIANRVALESLISA